MSYFYVTGRSMKNATTARGASEMAGSASLQPACAMQKQTRMEILYRVRDLNALSRRAAKTRNKYNDYIEGAR